MSADLRDERTGAETSKVAIIVIDDEPFPQECVIAALRGYFPSISFIGIPTVEELQVPAGLIVELVLIKVKSRVISREPLADDIKTIGRCFPDIPVVAITVCDDDANVIEAIAAGARGVLPVTASLKIAVAALQLVMAGGTFSPRPILGNGHQSVGEFEAAQSQAEHSRQISLGVPYSASEETGSRPATVEIAERHSIRETNGGHRVFTTREAEVLAALQKGRSNKWIADHLNLSQNTIKVHIKNIMRKLHATNRTEAVILSRHFALDKAEGLQVVTFRDYGSNRDDAVSGRA
jgi:DNA-binding NarL/FixJ family response regulator